MLGQRLATSLLNKMNTMETNQEKMREQVQRLEMSIMNLQGQLNTLNLQLQAEQLKIESLQNAMANE